MATPEEVANEGVVEAGRPNEISLPTAMICKLNDALYVLVALPELSVFVIVLTIEGIEFNVNCGPRPVTVTGLAIADPVVFPERRLCPTEF
jgi:hypothetical protein